MAANILSTDITGKGQFRSKEAGVVLIAALIALVAMTLAALALVRSIDTGLTIAGNMAFKSVATTSADIATDYASSWLRGASFSGGTALLNNTPASSYYASWMSGCDLTGNETPTATGDNMQWNPAGAANALCGAKASSVPGMPSGYSATYVITRMCGCEGKPGAAVCPSGTINICAGIVYGERFHGTGDANYRPKTEAETARLSTDSPYYRIVTRVEGPRKTVSFVEQIVTLE